MSAKYQDYPIYTYDQPVTYNDFTGGINTDPSNEHLLPNEMRDCLNMEFLSGALVKRKGGKKICNIKLEEDDGEVEEEGITQGIFLFADNSASGSITHIIIARCGKLYSGIYSVNKYKSCPTLTLKRLHIRTKIKKRGEDLFDKTNVMYGLPNSENDDGYAECYIINSETNPRSFDSIESSNTEYYYEMCFQTREKIEAAHINNPETQCNEMYLATGTRIVKITEGTDRKLYAEPLSPYLLNGVEIENIGFNDLCPIPTYGTRSGDSDAAATSMYGSLQVTPKLKTDASGAFEKDATNRPTVEFNIAPQISYAQHESASSYAMRWSHKANASSQWIVKEGGTFSELISNNPKDYFEEVYVKDYEEQQSVTLSFVSPNSTEYYRKANIVKALSDVKNEANGKKYFIKNTDNVGIISDKELNYNYPGFTETTLYRVNNVWEERSVKLSSHFYRIDKYYFGVDESLRVYADDYLTDHLKVSCNPDGVPYLIVFFGKTITFTMPATSEEVSYGYNDSDSNGYGFKLSILKAREGSLYRGKYFFYIGVVFKHSGKFIVDYSINNEQWIGEVAKVRRFTNNPTTYYFPNNNNSDIFVSSDPAFTRASEYYHMEEDKSYMIRDPYFGWSDKYSYNTQRNHGGTKNTVYKENGKYYLCTLDVVAPKTFDDLEKIKDIENLANTIPTLKEAEQHRLDIGKDFICTAPIHEYDSESPETIFAGYVVFYNNCLYECMNNTTTSKGDPETNKADWMKRTDFETIYVEDNEGNPIPTIDYKPLSIFGSYVGRAETPANLKKMWESFMDSGTVRELFAEEDATTTTISQMPTITPNENFTRIHSCTKVTGDGNKLLFYGDRSQSGWWFKTIVSNPAYITKRGCLSFKTSKDEYVEKVIPFQGNLVVFANSKRLGGSIHIVRGNGDDYDDGSQYFSPYSRRTVNAEVSTTNADTVKICDNLLIFKYFNRLYYIQASDLNNEVITVNTCNDRILSESEDLKIPWDDDSCIAETTDKCYSLVWKEKFAVDEFGNEYVEHPAMRIKMYYKMFNQMKDRNTLMPWLRDESNIFNSSYIFSMEGQPVYLYKDALITFGDQVYTDLGDDYECYAKLRGFDLEHPQLYKLISNIVLYYHRDHDKTCDVKLDLTNEAGFEMLSNAGKRSFSDLRAMRAQSGLNLMRANEKFSLASGVVTDTKVINTPYKFPCLNVSPTIRANSSGGLFSIESITFNYTTIDAMDTTASDLYSRIIRPDLL